MGKIMEASTFPTSRQGPGDIAPAGREFGSGVTARRMGMAMG